MIHTQQCTIKELYYNFYEVPDYQREYRWEDEQVGDLLGDVYEALYGEDKQDGYFLGSIVVCKDKNEIYRLIDGQQRVTTIYLIVCAARDVMKEKEIKGVDWVDKLLADVHPNPDTRKDQKKLRLMLLYPDARKFLNGLIENGELPKPSRDDTKSVERLRAAYNFTRDFYKDKFQDDPSEILEFLDRLGKEASFIRIEVSNEENAQNLFEKMNARGVSLEVMDLLKNRLFMHASDEDYRKLGGDWKGLSDTLTKKCKVKPTQFLRYYVMANHSKESINEKVIYDWLLKHRDDPGVEIPKKPLEFVDKLVKCADAYAYFYKSQDSDGEEVPYLGNIVQFASRAFRQHYILLLAARHFKEEHFKNLCGAIENFGFCHLVTGGKGNALERMFPPLSEGLRKVKTNADLDRFIKEHFYKEVRKKSSHFDTYFREANEGGIPKYRIRYILAKFNKFLEKRGAQEGISDYIGGGIEVEHILPETPHKDENFDKPKEERDEYYKKLGNLTLLSEDKNKSISNNLYKAKKETYGNSNFWITKLLVKELSDLSSDKQFNESIKDVGFHTFDEWSSKKIDERQEMLRKLARKVWKIDEACEAGKQTGS